MISGGLYVCVCGAEFTFEPPSVVCRCGRVHCNWVLAARLPRDSYRVVTTVDGWDVLVPE